MSGRSLCRGQAMAEYLLGCAVLVIALLLPWNDGRSVMAELLAAVRGHLRMGMYLMSLY